jgi:hypothetical protein
MDKLVLANIAERPTRAAASVLGVAIGIVLIVVTSGLARGMLGSTAERESAVGAELLFQPPGSFGAGVTTVTAGAVCGRSREARGCPRHHPGGSLRT